MTRGRSIGTLIFPYSPPIWELTDSGRASAAAELRRVVECDEDYPAGRFDGRGIVMCAGGARLLTNAWVAIGVLRRVLGCRLPIELWHIGPDELGRVESDMFAELGAAVVDALELPGVAPPRIRGGWELKSYAIVHSQFRELIYLDADNVAVRDPAPLLDSPEFAQTGAIAWPDVGRLRLDNPIWSLCGLEPRSEPSWESGQLVIDKARCWHALQIALHMNMHSEVFYRDLHGDKDTFHLGFRLAGTPWSMPAFPAKATKVALCQRDFSGELIFQHRTNRKWRLHGPNDTSDDFLLQDQCLHLLDQLAERWSGRVDPVPSREDTDLARERELAAIGWFELIRLGGERVLVELLPGNRVGIGADGRFRQRWFVTDGTLVLDGRHGRLAAMRQMRGDERWASGEQQPGWLLVPAPECGQDAIGLAVAAVLERFALTPGRDATEFDGGGSKVAPRDEPDTVTALLVLGAVAPIDDALQRGAARWSSSLATRRVIAAVRHRIGVHDASLAPHVLHDRYETID